VGLGRTDGDESTRWSTATERGGEVVGDDVEAPDSGSLQQTE
jgi:hypothetical protein